MQKKIQLRNFFFLETRKNLAYYRKEKKEKKEKEVEDFTFGDNFADALVLSKEEMELFVRNYATQKNMDPDAVLSEIMNVCSYTPVEYKFDRSNPVEKEACFCVVRFRLSCKRYLRFVQLYGGGRCLLPRKYTGDCFIVFADWSRFRYFGFKAYPYDTYEDLLNEFKGKLQDYLPESFEWDTHIGTVSYVLQ